LTGGQELASRISNYSIEETSSNQDKLNSGLFKSPLSLMKNSSLLENLSREFTDQDDSGVLSNLTKSYLVINYTYRTKQSSLKLSIRELASLLLQILKNIFRGGNIPRINTGSPILTFMSERPHLFRINDLLAIELNELCNRALFYTSKSSIKSKAQDFKGFKGNFARVFAKIPWGLLLEAIQSFQGFIKAKNLPASHLTPFTVHLVRQYWSYYSYRELFKLEKVPYVICEYDQYNEIAAFILAARESGIPTYTQTHGLLNSQFAYTPLIAENIFVWGQYHKQLLKSWGIEESKIHVSGAVQYQRVEDLNSKRNTLLESYGLKQRVISLATNPMQPTVQAALISFVEALVPLLPKEWSFILRPHPSEQMKPYQAQLESIGVKVVDNSLMPIQNLLGLSDLVMVWNSAFAVDALVNKIPTVHIDLNGIKSEGEVIRLVAEKLIPSFSKPAELLEYLEKFDTQNAERFFMQTQDYDRFKQVYCVATGKEAAENIKKHLSQHINENNNE
jgi:hypothetical protein